MNITCLNASSPSYNPQAKNAQSCAIIMLAIVFIAYIAAANVTGELQQTNVTTIIATSIISSKLLLYSTILCSFTNQEKNVKRHPPPSITLFHKKHGIDKEPNRPIMASLEELELQNETIEQEGQESMTMTKALEEILEHMNQELSKNLKNKNSHIFYQRKILISCNEPPLQQYHAINNVRCESSWLYRILNALQSHELIFSFHLNKDTYTVQA